MPFFDFTNFPNSRKWSQISSIWILSSKDFVMASSSSRKYEKQNKQGRIEKIRKKIVVEICRRQYQERTQSNYFNNIQMHFPLSLWDEIFFNYTLNLVLHESTHLCCLSLFCFHEPCNPISNFNLNSQLLWPNKLNMHFCLPILFWPYETN
jgi:hypothetical protein